ncbi:hypothetical protein BDN70DRAFT_875232 [Pholiota conissans]|uniref:Uncharacterized protein n=1 Tax=Pholiota conissans TaxID=109636 RepID=A0A9P5Z6G5_9AGAR|nr:hypothetical protein BDN70DRAFT_875232 [Pholiota conissans]
MATLTRSKPKGQAEVVSNPFLDSEVPSPFPREQLVAEQRLSSEDLAPRDDEEEEVEESLETSASIEHAAESSTTVALKDVMPSIQHVQRSCLMTLNTLLSEPIHWSPILPDRRHSMPSSPTLVSSTLPEDSAPTSALHTLVTNLRNHEANGEMIEAKASATDAELLSELHLRVEGLSNSLSAPDAALAKALVSLLSDLNRLSDIRANTRYLPSHILSEETSSILEAPPPVDLFDTLTRQLSDLQLQRLSTQAGVLSSGASPLHAVETTLLWSRIDAELDNVVAMCRERTETVPKFQHDHTLPPQYQYDMEGFEDDLEHPPGYEMDRRVSYDDGKKVRPSLQVPNSRQMDEKMRLDLEAVTMAIDRLYSAAPQLHNQRVELKTSKLEQMEKARREGLQSEGSSSASSSRAAQRKDKEKDAKDLQELFELISKASERTLKDQSVVMDDTMQARLLERSRNRATAKKNAFVEQLFRHAEAGRLHGQDAILQPRVRDPKELISLPEFIRESLPPSERTRDAEALLTLPEFVKEAIPHYILHPEEAEPELPEFQTSEKGKEKKRSRSLSAPPLAWLRSISNSSQSSSGSISKGKAKAAHNHGFDIVYVAENRENLHHVLVFFTATGLKAGTELQAEILPLFPDALVDGGEHLVIKAGPYSSLPLLLPGHITPGPKGVSIQSGHYEIKLETHSSAPTSFSTQDGEPRTPLLDASQLAAIHPNSFLCASCSLPLVQAAKIGTWRDLPSEHWEELVEAWMCHGDQKLHDHVQRHSRTGFWPSEGLALVGGSYILFEESAMNEANLLIGGDSKHNDNWRLTRCLCGAVVGRCKERETEQGNTIVHRILKYAVRPISLTADPVRIPLSAFIVEDMMEYVEAHASYRFVIQDEEEENPRILIWLFKPRIRLAYTTPRSHAIPKSANINAAKVLYKLIKPPVGGMVDIKSILNKYPGFPQAEYLSYPMAICRRLAGLLQESNSAYPESLRTMTGLEVGWLRRA